MVAWQGRHSGVFMGLVARITSLQVQEPKKMLQEMPALIKEETSILRIPVTAIKDRF